MFPNGAPVYMPTRPSKATRIAELQGHIARLVQFADALEKFALLFQPGHPEIVDQLRRAWLKLQTKPYEEAIQEIENQPSWDPPAPTAETLIHLVESRDKTQSQLDALARAKEKMAETVPGLGEMMDATAVPILQSQLEMLNQQITTVQAQLEKPAAT